MRIGMPAFFAARTTSATLSGAADVAGVDPHGGDTRVDRPQREARVEVDVGDDRDRREPDDLRQRVGVLALRHRDARDLAAGGGERGDLRRRRLDVVRLRQRHRLHDDGRAAADLHAADRDRRARSAIASSSLAAADIGRCRSSGRRRRATARARCRPPRPARRLAPDRAAAHALDDRERDVPAVERQQRQQVEQREREADQPEHLEVARAALLDARWTTPGRCRRARDVLAVPAAGRVGRATCPCLRTSQVPAAQRTPRARAAALPSAARAWSWKPSR